MKLMYSLRPTMASGTLHSSVSAEGPTLQTKSTNMTQAWPSSSNRKVFMPPAGNTSWFLVPPTLKSGNDKIHWRNKYPPVHFVFIVEHDLRDWMGRNIAKQKPIRCKSNKANTIPLLGQGSQLCTYGCKKRKRQWVARNCKKTTIGLQ